MATVMTGRERQGDEFHGEIGVDRWRVGESVLQLCTMLTMSSCLCSILASCGRHQGVDVCASACPRYHCGAMGPWDMYVLFGGGLLSVRSSRLISDRRFGF